MELGKIATPPPKPSVKRELAFETPDTPKKAKAPAPTRKVISCVVNVKTEDTPPTAAKSKAVSPVVGPVPPPPSPKHSVPPSKGPAPIPPVVPKPVPSMKKEVTPIIPPPSKPTGQPSQPRTAQQEKAAQLRRMQPLPEPGSNSSPGSDASTVMAERRRSNKMQDMTDEDILELQIEQAILEEISKKSDDEIEAMFDSIKKHHLFPKFAQEQREETGVEEWEFDDVDQLPTWEIWVQKQLPKQHVAPSATPKQSVPVAPKALSITPPPSGLAVTAITPAKANTPVAKAPEPPVVPKHVAVPKPASTPVQSMPPPPPKAVNTPKVTFTPAASTPVAKQPSAPVCSSQTGTAFGITLKDGSTVTCHRKRLINSYIK